MARKRGQASNRTKKRSNADSEQSLGHRCLHEILPSGSIKKAHIRIDQKLHKNIRRDPDNCFPKYIIDSIVEAKILEDDNWEVLPEGIKITKPVIVSPPTPEELIITIKVLK